MTCINGEVLNHNLVSSSLNLIMFKILTRKLYWTFHDLFSVAIHCV